MVVTLGVAWVFSWIVDRSHLTESIRSNLKMAAGTSLVERDWGKLSKKEPLVSLTSKSRMIKPDYVP